MDGAVAGVRGHYVLRAQAKREVDRARALADLKRVKSASFSIVRRSSSGSADWGLDPFDLPKSPRSQPAG